MKKAILTTQDLTKSFMTGKKQNTIINHMTLSFYEGDFTVIMGPSGAGKSTLLYTISGMDRVSSGKVLYQGKDMTTLKENQMAQLRAKDFGFVFQQANLVSNLTLAENIYIAGCIGQNKPFTNQSQVRNKTEALLTSMQLTQAKDRLPSACSGGEAQRAAVARAAIHNPQILFADEPTGALNRQNSIEVLNLLDALYQKGQSIIMVTHDIKAAIRGNRILYLVDGQIKGEKQLPPYTEETAKEREEDVSSWLMEKSW